jgi:transcriptional regulator with XRE-family HTH domain
MSFGDNLKKYREKAGLSQSALGAKMGLQGSIIGRYELGVSTPKPDRILKFAYALGVDTNALLGYEYQEIDVMEYVEENITRWDFEINKSFAKYPICGEDGNTMYVKIPIKKFTAMCNLVRTDVEYIIEEQGDAMRSVLFMHELDKEVYNFINSKEYNK